MASSAPSYADSAMSSMSSECGDPTPSYSKNYPFTLYQHQVEFDPPLDYAASKYKLLVEFAEYSPSLFNGRTLFMTRAVPPKYNIGRYVDPKDPKKSVTWTFRYIGKVWRSQAIYKLFNEVIFIPGVNMKIFNLENKSTDASYYQYEKRFDDFSLISLHRHYKTTIRFSGFNSEIMYCSEFADPSSPKQKHYDLVPNPSYCYNAKDYFTNLFSYLTDKRGKEEIMKDLNERPKVVIAAYSGKIHKIGFVDFTSSPRGFFTDWHDKGNMKTIRFLDHYKAKYGIEIPEEEQAQIMLVAFPTAHEDVAMKGKVRNIYLIPSLCYVFKEWQGPARRYE